MSSESFQLLFLDSVSLEETYRTLFDRIEALGSGDAFVASMQERKKDLLTGPLKERPPAVELVARVVQRLASKLQEEKQPASESSSSLAGVLGDASVRQLVEQYLDHIPSQQRRQLVQVSSTLQLIVQVRCKHKIISTKNLSTV